ncbi:MAG: hypothetical protein WCG93_01020 [Paludibacter sp.]
MKKKPILLLLAVSAFAILLGVQHVWFSDKWDREQTYLFNDNQNISYSPIIEIPKAKLNYKTTLPNNTLETGVIFTESKKNNYKEASKSTTSTSEENTRSFQTYKSAKVDFHSNSYSQTQQPEKTEAKNTTDQQSGMAYKGIYNVEVKQFSNTNTSTFIADNTISTTTDLTSADHNSPMLVGPTGNPGDPGVIPVGDGIPFLLALIAIYGVRKVFFNS